MEALAALVLFAASMVGTLLAVLLAWQALVAILRLVLGVHTPGTVALLLGRLAEAARGQQPWEPVLRGLRLELPWPWPWRLGRAADRLAAGDDAAEVLAASRLLPAGLRQQAAQALRQGPAAFAQWCAAIARQPAANTLAVRQGTFLLAEFMVALAMLHFLAIFIFPKFTVIMRELGLAAPTFLVVAQDIDRWEAPLLLAVVAAAGAGCTAVLALRWRRRRRQAAARLLLAGSAARLPEAALGTDAGFAGLCAGAGWTAATPAELARALARDEMREAQRAAWLPSVAAALAPLLGAIPIGAVVIGTMQMLISIIVQLESRI